MPPFVGRKRVSTSPIPAAPPRKKAKVQAKAAVKAPVRKTAAKKTAAVFSLSDSESSSLSDVDSDEFEDVAGSSKPKKAQAAEESDKDIDWEDAPAQEAVPDFSERQFKDVKITVDKDEDPMSYTVRAPSKKGPSRREKESRMLAHKMHVQFLLWHNAKRNAWANDEVVHKILLRQLPSQITKEIEKWKRASGLIKPETSPKDKKKKGKKWKANGERNERDWGRPSQLLDEGKPDMSSGDPLISLLKILAAFWKKKFAIVAPGLRKRGYGPKYALRKDIDSFRNDKHHPAKHGEKIESLEHFRKLAEKCEGSRDLGAQLFTALLRAIGIESRMVASLQPVGYGFTKAEEMIPRKIIDPEEPDAEPAATKSKAAKKRQTNTKQGVKGAPIDLDSDSNSSELSEDGSVVDVTPSIPKARPPKYDRDLLFPIYWAEAISPITSKVYPVTPFLFDNPVATSAELLMAFEPKGAKAEQTRQVMAYVVAFSSDCTAKDVTVRYLRKRQWPGKTKAFRVPMDKIPIHDKHGKIKRSEDYDWFKHALSFYTRQDANRTAVDDTEDATDLIPAEPEKKLIEGDTLQSLKSSPDFVIERHLRREEALIPGAKSVRTFSVGKGDKQEDHLVYKRSDVRRVMTAESWHKEGRAPKEGEAPMKLAPVRAVTLARKREAEAHLIRTGEKQMQGLYSIEQTDYIIPPPIENGVIPKNSYGNIDCFVPSMVPRGAVHLPLKGTVRICKKLEIDFAEAVVGFEFGNKMAVPVIHGVVIAKENEKVVRDAWRVWNEEQRKKEETKMEKLVLEMWRKMVTGLRIRARVSEEYGVPLEQAGLAQGNTVDQPIDVDEDESTLPGGFEPGDDDDFGGGFLVDHEDEPRPLEDLVMDHPASQEIANTELLDASQVYPTPMSPANLPKPVRRARPELLPDEESEDEEMEDVEEAMLRTGDVAGGFLVDDDSPLSASEEEPVPTPKKRGKPAAKATLKSDRVKKQGGVPASTRETLGRAAKAQISNMQDFSSDGSASDVHLDGASSDDSEDVKVARIKKSGTRTTTVKAKRRRPKKETAPASGRKATRLLRKESTIVTSPYFKHDD